MAVDSVIGGKKGKPIARADFNGGWIAVYASKAGFRFEALCGNKFDHGNKCRIGRTNLPRDGNPAAGRPLGMIACHLLKNSTGAKDDHMLNSMTGYPLEERQAAREMLKLCDADGLFAKERPRRPGEPEEPVDDP